MILTWSYYCPKFLFIGKKLNNRTKKEYLSLKIWQASEISCRLNLTFWQFLASVHMICDIYGSTHQHIKHDLCRGKSHLIYILKIELTACPSYIQCDPDFQLWKYTKWTGYKIEKKKNISWYIRSSINLFSPELLRFVQAE